MRSRLLTLFLAASVAACAGETAEQAAEGAQEYAAGAGANAEAVAAVAAIAQYWQTHYNMGHASMVVSKVVDDAIYWSGDGTMLFGKPALEAHLTAEIAAGKPQVQIKQDEALVFGNYASGRGTYSVTATADGQSVTNTGYWMTLAENVGGEWKLHGVVSNQDSEGQTTMPSEQMAMPAPSEGASLLAESSQYYVTHFNMGHAPMVAQRYTEDAVGMFSGAPALTGRAAIQERLTRLTEAGAKLSITPFAARELDAQHIAGIGTYTLEVPGQPAVSGHFAALYRRGADGLMIHRVITGNHPAAM